MQFEFEWIVTGLTLYALNVIFHILALYFLLDAHIGERKTVQDVYLINLCSVELLKTVMNIVGVVASMKWLPGPGKINTYVNVSELLNDTSFMCVIVCVCVTDRVCVIVSVCLCVCVYVCMPSSRTINFC